jgi:hypothetical protein
LGNLAKANFFQGDGGLLSNLTISAGSSIVNGNSNVIVTANGNVNTSVAGNANILIITGTGANVSGTFNATGNITGANITGNHYGAGNNLSNIQGANVSGTVANATYAVTAGTANAVAGSNVSGTVANATFATSAGSATTAGTVTTAAQTNITSVGTLTSLAVTGNITGANISVTTQLVSTVANGTAPLAVSSQTRVANLNVDFLDGYQPSLTAIANTAAIRNANASITANVFIGNIAGTNVTGQVGNALVAGTVYTNAQPNITSVGTLTSLSVGNVTSSQFMFRSVTTGISAFGSNQATATTLTKEINIVSTVTSGQGVALPTAVAGMVLYVTNTSANSLLVYPASGGIINALSANAALTQGAGATLQFIAPTTTQWYSVGATYS